MKKQRLKNLIYTKKRLRFETIGCWKEKKRGDLVKASFNDEKIALAYVLAASALSLTLSIDPTVSCIETLPPENRMNFPIQYDPTVAILQIENRQWNQQDLFEMDLKDLKNLIKKG